MRVPSLSPEIERELESLRRRAYGPEADIAADPEAAGRLDRLERQARAMAVAGGGSEATALDGAPTVGSDGGERHGADDAPGGGQHPAAESQPPSPRPWWRRRSTWIAVTTVAVSAAVATTISYAAAGPRPDVSLAMTSQIPTDTLTGNILWLISAYELDRTSMIGHDGFGAISVWTARTEGGMRCLFLTTDDRYELATSCMPAGLDPTIDLTLYPGMTDIIGGGYPERTALRFVLRADTVDVWVRPPLR